jgi:hypothetical protein
MAAASSASGTVLSPSITLALPAPSRPAGGNPTSCQVRLEY